MSNSYPKNLFSEFYRPQRWLWKGYVFTGVCLSTGAGVHPLGRTPGQIHLLGRQPPWADTSLADTLPRQTPPQMATAVDGTHPTGMHSS